MNKDKQQVNINNMSSHHIVREKQEPALLVLGLNSFPEEMLGQLLEWSPTVITTPFTAEHINSLGIKVDIIIADKVDLNSQSDIKLIPPGDNPVTAALNFLLINDYKAVNILTDDLQLSQLTPYASQINLVVFSYNQKIYPVTPGFSKWKPAAQTIEMLSPAPHLIANGLKQQRDNTYTTIADGFFSLQFDAPFLFIAEEI